MEKFPAEAGEPVMPAILNGVKYRSNGGVWPYQFPGIMFNSIESACTDRKNTFQFVTQPQSETVNRTSMTLNCLERGLQYNEMVQGHGKMFIRPQEVKYLSSPHRLDHYYIKWTTPQNFGRIHHFNFYKYSHLKKPLEIDHSLQNFTAEQILRTGAVTFPPLSDNLPSL